MEDQELDIEYNAEIFTDESKIELMGKLLAESVVIGSATDLQYRAIIDNPTNRRILENKIMDFVIKF